MRILVCGGRDFSDTRIIFNTLDKLAKSEQIDCIIEGDARGADRIAGSWAKWRRVDLKLFPAQWFKHGKAAGPIRNQKMLDVGKPDLVVAFPGGKGTADIISRAERSGVRVMRINGE